MSLTWTYKDFWMWFEKLDTVSKRMAWAELNRDKWLELQPYPIQLEVLEHAPRELKENIMSLDIFKPETKIKIMFALRRE